MTKHPYLDQLVRQLDAVSPGVYQHLDTLDSLPKTKAMEVVGILLTDACQAQNDLVIRLGREGLSAIPRAWLQAVLPEAIERFLNLDDDWEYRRLLEFLQESLPALLPDYARRGLASKNAEIREAAEDYIKA
jgi:hypothetical protein